MKVEAQVHWGLKALILPSDWYWRFKKARTIIWLPLNGEPQIVELLIKDAGKKILVRVNHPKFFFSTKKVIIYDFWSTILIREVVAVETLNNEEFEIEEVIDELPTQQSQTITQSNSQSPSQEKPPFSPWELVRGLQVEVPDQ